MGEPAEVQAKVLEGRLNRRRENRTLGGGLAWGKKRGTSTRLSNHASPFSGSPTSSRSRRARQRECEHHTGIRARRARDAVTTRHP